MYEQKQNDLVIHVGYFRPYSLVYLLPYFCPIVPELVNPARRRGTEGIPCLPTSSVKYVHLLASVLPPCGMTQREFFIAHDIN